MEMELTVYGIETIVQIRCTIHLLFVQLQQRLLFTVLKLTSKTFCRTGFFFVETVFIVYGMCRRV